MSNGSSKTLLNADDAVPGAELAMRITPAERPVVPLKSAARPVAQSDFYQLIGIGWLALAAISIWIAILY